MKPSPKITLIIPTLDRSRTLSRILACVARQTLKPDEVLVVDDGSRDAAAVRRALSPFKTRLKGLRLIRNARRLGTSASRNLAILQARHPLIAFSDDDDEWDGPKLRLQVEPFRKDWKGTDLVYCWHRKVIHGKGVTQVREDRFEGRALGPMLHSCFFIPSTVLVKKERLVQAGLFDTAILQTEDWEMWVRFFRKGFTCRVVPRALVTYNVHAGSFSLVPNFGHLHCLMKHWPAFLREAPGAVPKVLKRTLREAARLLLGPRRARPEAAA